MSLAPSSAAWKISELTSRTSGASEMPSSASRSSSSLGLVEVGDVADERGVHRPGGTREPPQLGEDVVLGGDEELDRQARGEAQLVEAAHVLRVGDRELEVGAVGGERNRAGALEHRQRDRLRRLGVDAGDGEVDERQADTARPACARRRARSRAPRRRAPARTTRRPARRRTASTFSDGRSPVSRITSATRSPTPLAETARSPSAEAGRRSRRAAGRAGCRSPSA